jgi:hypothetical protein
LAINQKDSCGYLPELASVEYPMMLGWREYKIDFAEGVDCVVEVENNVDRLLSGVHYLWAGMAPEVIVFALSALAFWTELPYWIRIPLLLRYVVAPQHVGLVLIVEPAFLFAFSLFPSKGP